MLAGDGVFRELGAVAPDRECAVAKSQLHVIIPGAAHTGQHLGFGTQLDSDAAPRVVVLAALANNVGKIVRQFRRKIHACAG